MHGAWSRLACFTLGLYYYSPRCTPPALGQRLTRDVGGDHARSRRLLAQAPPRMPYASSSLAAGSCNGAMMRKMPCQERCQDVFMRRLPAGTCRSIARAGSSAPSWAVEVCESSRGFVEALEAGHDRRLAGRRSEVRGQHWPPLLRGSFSLACSGTRLRRSDDPGQSSMTQGLGISLPVTWLDAHGPGGK